MAYAAVYGCAVSVRKKRYPDLPSGKDTVLDLANIEGKKQEKSKTMNVIAVDNLSMTFTSK